jgi:two-component system chemotaxis sensor kinase CheA
MSDTLDLPEEVRIFLLEGYELLDQAETDLLLLEKDSSKAELFNSVFRGIHTIKGNSGFLNLVQTEKVCHTSEGVLDRLRSGKLVVRPELISALLSGIDVVRELLRDIESTGAESARDVTPLLRDLARYSSS